MADYVTDLWEFKSTLTEDDILQGKKHIVDIFLKYMKPLNHLKRAEIQEEYEKNPDGFKDFYEYVYKKYLGLDRDIQKEYRRLKEEAEERVREYEHEISKLILALEKEKEESPRDHRKCDKLKYIINVNLVLYKKSLECTDWKYLFDSVWIQSDPFNKNFAWIDHNFGILTLEQYEDTDWKHLINFNYLLVPDSEALRILRTTNHSGYIAKFKECIAQYEICDVIIKTVKQNHLLYKRLPVFESAIRLYENHEYMSFISLIALQVEGLFNEWSAALGLAPSKKSLNDTLQKLQDKERRVRGYIFFAFEFPELRNKVAHGEILTEDLEETAMDLLSELYFLIYQIDSDNYLPVNIIRKFFKTMNSIFKDHEIELIVKQLQDLMDQGDLLQYLQPSPSSEVERIIEFYHLRECIELFKSQFRKKEFWEYLCSNEEYALNNEKKIRALLNVLQLPDEIKNKYVSTYFKKVKSIKNAY